MTATSLLELSGAVKRFGRGAREIVALDHIDFTVEQGAILGLLGPNGSGKTTALRAAVGLIRLDEGSVRLLGEPVPDRLGAVVADVGALIDAPRFFSPFSARQRLRLLATDRRLPATRVDEVLEQVGLSDRADDPVGKFSLGMRQRLGVATALLGAPRLLLLDEPMNGLDPIGVRDMRDLLQRLNGEGVTILVSSHQLAEIEELCTEVAVFAKGALVHQGALAGFRSDRHDVRVVIEIDDLEAAVRRLRSCGWGVEAVGPTTARVHVAGHSPSEVNRCLADAGLYASGISEERRTLEAAFLDLVAPSDRRPGSERS